MPGTCYTKHSFDVVVIGGGAAGALAAISAKRAGASVAFVTKESALVGGATVMAGGGTSAPVIPDDSGQVLYNDMMKAGQYINNPRVVSVVADNSMNALYNLENCDFLLDRKSLIKHGAEGIRSFKIGEGHTHPRGCLDRREALGFCHGISKSVMRHEIDIFTETIAVKLLKSDGAVCGVVAYSIAEGAFVAFRCKAVVLAAGGLGALYEDTTNSSVLTGDGYAMAFEAGAELVDMEMVQFMPLTFPYPRIRRGKIIGTCSMFGSSIKLYNGLGERYMYKYDPEKLEFVTRDLGSRANYIEIKEGRGTAKNTVIVDNRDFDPEILERWKTTNPFRYKQCCQSFGEAAGNWEETFEAIPSQHFFMGGVKINENMETTVPGLFAVGEVSGGVHGANRLSGVAFVEIFSLGPIAGRNAAAAAKCESKQVLIYEDLDKAVSTIDASVKRGGDGSRPGVYKHRLQKAMSDGLGPVRDNKGIAAAFEEFREIESELSAMRVASDGGRYNRDMMEALEIPLMLKTAQIVAVAAQKRTESRGAHFRSDYPEKNDSEWKKNVVIFNDSGKIGHSVISTVAEG